MLTHIRTSKISSATRTTLLHWLVTSTEVIWRSTVAVSRATKILCYSTRVSKFLVTATLKVNLGFHMFSNRLVLMFVYSYRLCRLHLGIFYSIPSRLLHRCEHSRNKYLRAQWRYFDYFWRIRYRQLIRYVYAVLRHSNAANVPRSSLVQS